MIKAVYIKGRDVVGLSVKGHSGYAESGKDIVCAAVSALVESMRLYLQECPYCSVREDGEAILMAATIAYEPAFDMVHVGLEALSEQYPDNIKIIVQPFRNGNDKR